MKISVIIPVTREKIVEKCVEALSKQTRMPDEIIFIVPCNWQRLGALLESYISRHHLRRSKIICSKDKRQMSMLNKGIDESKGEILAFTDDDAAPFPDWLGKIGEYFENNPDIGGVGGKDVLRISASRLEKNPRAVGKVTFYGRIIGRHSEWNSIPVETDSIKGCNMSFLRKPFPGFDEDLLGNQSSNEVSVSLKIRKEGYKIIYDPKILVKHFTVLKPQIWEEENFKKKMYVSTFNYTLTILRNFTPFRKFVFILYSFLVGQKMNPGIFELFILFKHSKKMIEAVPYIISGKMYAIRYYLKDRKGYKL